MLHVLLAAALHLGAFSRAAVIDVPADHATIQEAVDAAVGGGNAIGIEGPPATVETERCYTEGKIRNLHGGRPWWRSIRRPAR